MQTRTHKQGFYIMLLFVVAIIWGSGFIATQIAVDAGYSAAFILAVRFLLACLVFGAVFFRHIFPIAKGDWVGGGACGILLFASFTFQTLGLQHSTPSNNAFITATNIIIVPFLCWGLYKKRPATRVFVAALLCFLGVWMLSFTGSGLGSFGIGEGLTFIGAACFAGHTTCLGHYAQKMDTRRLNFLQLAVAAAAGMLLFAVSDRDLTQLRPTPALLSVAYLALFSTCIAYFIQTVAQKRVPASRVAIIISTESLFASVLSVALGYDKLGWQLLGGGALVLLSVLLVEMDFGRLRKGGAGNETAV